MDPIIYQSNKYTSLNYDLISKYFIIKSTDDGTWRRMRHSNHKYDILDLHTINDTICKYVSKNNKKLLTQSFGLLKNNL